MGVTMSGVADNKKKEREWLFDKVQRQESEMTQNELWAASGKLWYHSEMAGLIGVRIDELFVELGVEPAKRVELLTRALEDLNNVLRKAPQEGRSIDREVAISGAKTIVERLGVMYEAQKSGAGLKSPKR